MLVIENQAHFDKVIAFAKEAGLYEGEKNSALKNRLDYLDKYGSQNKAETRVRLIPDCAPQSFFFSVEKKNNGEWQQLFCGGLLYHGPHDGHGNGSGPTFAVTLEPTLGWSIHT